MFFYFWYPPWSHFLFQIIPEDQPVDICPGRVPASNEQLAQDTRTLSVIYQSIVIFFTFVLALIFLYMSYRLFSMASKGMIWLDFSVCGVLNSIIPAVSSAKMVIFRIGVIIVSAFMLRCILFIILLAVNFISDIYLFITLMITEVIMMFLVQAEFNKKFYASLLTGASSAMPTGANASPTEETVHSHTATTDKKLSSSGSSYESLSHSV